MGALTKRSLFFVCAPLKRPSLLGFRRWERESGCFQGLYVFFYNFNCAMLSSAHNLKRWITSMTRQHHNLDRRRLRSKTNPKDSQAKFYWYPRRYPKQRIIFILLKINNFQWRFGPPNHPLLLIIIFFPHNICWGRSTVWFITGIIERCWSMHFPETFGKCEPSTAPCTISERPQSKPFS